MTRFRWGVLGTGPTSAKFVAGIAAARNAEVSFVASRSLERAQKFANKSGIERAFQGYADAIATCRVDAVYVATPPSEHAAHAILCIEAGIAVLVEKPFAASAAEVVLVCNAARQHSVFIMEAMWTRFLPAAQAMKDLISSKKIGDVRLITGNFGTSQIMNANSSIFNPHLGGGALAHLGAYPLSLSQWMFGRHHAVQAVGSLGLTGVDEEVAFSLSYADGVIGSFVVSIRAWAPDQFYVLGGDGMIGFRGSIVRPNGLYVSYEKPRLPDEGHFGWRARMRQHPLVHQIAQRFGWSGRSGARRINHRYVGNGYNYEADEVRRCVEQGAVESQIMKLGDSIEVAEAADAVRRAVHERWSRGTQK